MIPSFVVIALLLLLLLFLLGMVISVFACLLLGVPFVPTSNKVVESMLAVGKPDATMTVYDLGCGDGRFLHAASLQCHVKNAIGYELALLPYLFGKIRGWIIRSKAQLYCRDFFSATLEDADMIFCYLTPHVMKKLEKKLLLEGKRGLRIISHAFTFPNLEPVRIHRKQDGYPANIYEYEL